MSNWICASSRHLDNTRLVIWGHFPLCGIFLIHSIPIHFRRIRKNKQIKENTWACTLKSVTLSCWSFLGNKQTRVKLKFTGMPANFYQQQHRIINQLLYFFLLLLFLVSIICFLCDRYNHLNSWDNPPNPPAGGPTEPLSRVSVMRNCFADVPEVARVTLTREEKENAGMVVLKSWHPPSTSFDFCVVFFKLLYIFKCVELKVRWRPGRVGFFWTEELASFLPGQPKGS